MMQIKDSTEIIEYTLCLSIVKEMLVIYPIKITEI